MKPADLRVRAEKTYLNALESSSDGSSPEVDRLCAEHPELSAELVELHEEWKILDSRRSSSASRRFPDLVERLYGGRADMLSVRSSDSTPPGAAANPLRPPDEGPWRARLVSAGEERYELLGEINRGGMGCILRVWEPDLRRELAMKVIKTHDHGTRPPWRNLDRPQLFRFLEEAQITGQLQHPGIPPVHELGLDATGEVYFTMPVVSGDDLQQVLDKHRRDDPRWSLTKVLNVILRACEAMSYAHSRGVVHRDLKPSNIMVGEFGEVYVMDWGLARVVDQPGRKGSEARPSPRTLRGDYELDRNEAALLTREGAAFGTPAYMPPEQARGETSQLGPRSDVYSMGAILYELLAGAPPYSSPPPATADEIVQRVVAGPPDPVPPDRNRPAELVAICEKAMRRDPEQRFDDMLGLGQDLQNFLEVRVVRAYETGAWAEIKKWVQRNKWPARLATVIVLLTLGFAAYSYVTSLVLEARNTEILGLSDIRRFEELIDAESDLWPIREHMIEEMKAWVSDAEALAGRIPFHEATRSKMREQARGYTEADRAEDHRRHPKYDELQQRRREREHFEYALALPETKRQPNATPDSIQQQMALLDSRIAELDTETRERQSWDYENGEVRWQDDQLSALILSLKTLTGPEGLLAQVVRRIGQAEAIEPETVGRYAEEWREAIASIADVTECPKYDGFELTPQVGLIPIRQDARSGLWEFLQYGTGEMPMIRGDGYAVTAQTGLVLVLLPGGSFDMGAMPPDEEHAEGDPNVVESAEEDWGPIHTVTLDPFFISKYELSQGQWFRLTGEAPSAYGPAAYGSEDTAFVYPVERISWYDCQRVLPQIELALPTEAQWEYAARAGTTTRWWFGNRPERLATAGNVADQALRFGGGKETWQYEGWNDRYVFPTPIFAMEPNGFGLHQVAGNVIEWCQDARGKMAKSSPMRDYDLPTDPATGARALVLGEHKVARGGGWQFVAATSASASRNGRLPNHKASSLGVRPVRLIEPAAPE